MTSRKISSRNPPSSPGIEAGRWLLRLLDLEPDPDDPYSDPVVCHEAFLDWLATSPQHVQVFLETFETYRRLGQIDPSRQISIPALLRQAADGTLRVRGGADRQARPGIGSRGFGQFYRSSRMAKWAVAAAAAVIVLYLGGGWPLFGLRSATATPLIYSTAVGERKTVALSDGTVLTLNTASRVEVMIDRRHRSVRLLQGEVLLAVHHEWVRPFEVIAEDVKVQDLGTQFDVYRRSTDVRVTVLEGHVRVLSDRNSTPQDQSRLTVGTLGAGEQADISTESKAPAITIRTLTAAQAREAIGWKEGKMYFHSQLLREVVDEFNRYNTRHLVITDPQIATLRLGGAFATPDIDHLIEVLHETWGIEVLPPALSNADSQAIRLGRGPASSR